LILVALCRGNRDETGTLDEDSIRDDAIALYNAGINIG
jgi:hypothetical protein